MIKKFYKAVCKLSNVKRFAALKLDREYSGAEHSYRVAMLSMVMVDEFNLNPSHINKIDKATVLSKALMHDLEESEVGDIPTPVKAYPGLRELVRKASLEILETTILDKNLPNREYYLKCWKEDKDEESGEIIELADKLEALMASAYELKRGNKDLQKAFNYIRPWFNTDRARFLLKKYPCTQELLKVADEVKVKIKASDALVG